MSTWSTPPEHPVAMPGEVHLWRVDLARPAEEVAGLARLLSADEQDRAARFHFARHRDRFVVARGRLRTILGRYLGCPPARVRFVYGAQGKPALHPDLQVTDLAFNISHSDQRMLCAVTHGARVGVDVEQIRAPADLDAISARFFAPAEQRALQALPADRQVAGFFACWTRKEAFIKALGGGLSIPLDAFVVRVDPAGPAALLAVEKERLPEPVDVDGWSICDIRVGPGFAAAMAIPQTAPLRTCWSGDFA